MATRILLVDDEEGLRITLAANLELEGFEVHEAASGAEALELLAKGSYDLMLTDIRMPGLSGVELFRRARASHPGMPVVLMTAFSVESLVDEALAEGAFTVLPKPFDVSAAVATLLRAARHPTVLVVDDVKIDAESTAEALRAAGVKASAVLDGDAALEALRSGAFDVCVVDLVMPGVSGSELAQRLRDAKLAVSVIAMSGYAVPELLQRVAAAGAVTVMKKPVAPRELVQTIARTRGPARSAR